MNTLKEYKVLKIKSTVNIILYQYFWYDKQTQNCLCWLVHISRADPSRLTVQAIKAQSQLGMDGNLMMNAPDHSCVEDLEVMVCDKLNWKALTFNIQ